MLSTSLKILFDVLGIDGYRIDSKSEIHGKGFPSQICVCGVI